MINSSPVISPESTIANPHLANLHPETANGEPGAFTPQLTALFSPEFLADWVWAYEQAQTYGFNDYIGQHVAIINKKIVSFGTDYAQLRKVTAETFAVDPERIVIMSMPATFANFRGGS